MSRPPRLPPARAVMAGITLLVVLAAGAGVAFLISRDRPGAATAGASALPTVLAQVGDVAAPVSPFPALTPFPGVTPSAQPSLTVPQSTDAPRGDDLPRDTGTPPATGATPTPAAPRSTPRRTAAPDGTTTSKDATPPAATTTLATPPRLIAVTATPVSDAALQEIIQIKDVTKVTLADAGAVRFSSATLNLLAVDPAEFRPWAPKAVAEEPAVWDALARGEFVADSATAGRYMLRLGGEYEAGAGSRLRVAAAATFGLPGVDGLVGTQAGRALGLAARVAVLVHTPAARAEAVGARIKRVLGAGTQVVPVGARPASPGKPAAVATPTAPVAPPAQATGRPSGYLVGRPGGYLELYQLSARICPGLSWTVLAAIGQVESGHGRNNGPSSAGALGPMQFMPATWKAYGVDGDGDGRSDIWSPYDAVPAAARYLCANGAGAGGAKLRSAVWRYNHSWAYVDKVLGIADAYARAYS
ncbi:lytic murein transglycosylase [Sphaerisporangium melleum]|uniref:lytic transglycosylase domain-containing protein n=1 Tax=Sphaerisporangium melleum TaxID=321316 RepID=UPI001E6496FE|nr:lytic transglycosylase domain-containing protein [Sphaerisporangium melleum]